MKTLKLICLAASILLLPMSNIFGQSTPKIEKRNRISHQDFSQPNHNLSKLLTGYTFTKSTGTYDNLFDSISISNDELWDDFEGVLPIGFDFEFFDATLNTLYFGAGFGGLVSSAYDEDYLADYVIAPFEADLVSRSLPSEISDSPISYKLIGQPGSRVLKIEWKNAGFYSEADELGTLNDFVNFQLWLYEGSNDIEMRYGPNKITNPEINYTGDPGPLVGIVNLVINDIYLLIGDPSDPDLTSDIDVLNGTPENGTIYKFSKMVSSTENGIQEQSMIAQITPNPFHSSAVITVKNSNLINGELKITDVNGKLVKRLNNIQSNEVIINRDNLANGVYFYTLTDQSKHIQTGKFVIE